MPRSSGTSARPASTMACAGMSVRSTLPSPMRAPGMCATMPPSALRQDDLPAPLAPSMTTISPAPTLSDTPSSARCLP